MIERHLTNVLTYFKHRVTNATSEGINAGVQLLSSRARGFRNFANFRVAILFRHTAASTSTRVKTLRLEPPESLMGHAS